MGNSSSELIDYFLKRSQRTARKAVVVGNRNCCELNPALAAAAPGSSRPAESDKRRHQMEKKKASDSGSRY